MSFATRSEERMRIDRDGNVSIGHTAGNYTLDVAGDANCVSLTIQIEESADYMRIMGR